MKRFLLTGCIAIGLMACSDSDDLVNGGGDQKGNTYASINVTLKNTQTRALSDGQNDNSSTDAEQKMEDLLVLSTASNQSFTFAASGSTDGTFWFNSPNYITSPWKTTPGTQTLALLFNKNTASSGNANSTASHLYEGWSTGLIAPFTMTSKAFVADVKADITKDQAASGTTPAENVFGGVEVERVVSKGVVRMASDYSDKVTQANEVVATVSNVTFAAVNGAKKTFLYRDNAGSRTMEDADLNQYTGFTSAIDGLAPIKDATAADAAGLIRLGVTGVPTDISAAKAINAASADVGDAATKVFYFLENSGELTQAMKDEGYYRFAYAKVYAVYKPTSVMTHDGDPDDKNNRRLIAKAGTGKFYDPNTLDNVQSTDPGAVEGFLGYKKLVAKTPTEATFYKGIGDGILYDSPEAAASSTLAEGQFAYTYKDGKCGYRTLWNRQTDDTTPTTVVNADVRRNNAYMVDIKSFAKLGFPWDESDPNDPNLPKVDPDSPNFPDPTDPSIETKETYMRVEAVVLPWNLVNRDGVILE